MKKILLTGAAGEVAQHLRRELAGRYHLRLSDLKPITPGPNEEFVQADIADFDQVLRAVDGMDGIIHLGGFSVEGNWEQIHSANIVGCYNVFEAARAKGAKRILFATSNHAAGFYRRDQKIDHTAIPKPDSRYGVSKAFGEALGSLYADKYGLEVFCMRIGNVKDRPMDVRRLSIWFSPRDLAQLVAIGLEHPDIHYEIVYGVSDNARSWWDNSNAERLGYRPQDKSEDYAAELLAKHKPTDARAEIYQGGGFVNA
ncbi:MAG: NAD(P)-dependent oxidoreductase, partial [Betaproteobacteria bacterium]